MFLRVSTRRAPLRPSSPTTGNSTRAQKPSSLPPITAAAYPAHRRATNDWMGGLRSAPTGRRATFARRTLLQNRAITPAHYRQSIEIAVGSVGIGTAGGAQRYGLACNRIDSKNTLTCDTIDHYIRRMISVCIIVNGPVHPRGEIVLILISPAPNGRFIGGVSLADHAGESNRVIPCDNA